MIDNEQVVNPKVLSLIKGFVSESSMGNSIDYTDRSSVIRCSPGYTCVLKRWKELKAYQNLTNLGKEEEDYFFHTAKPSGMHYTSEDVFNLEINKIANSIFPHSELKNAHLLTMLCRDTDIPNMQTGDLFTRSFKTSNIIYNVFQFLWMFSIGKNMLDDSTFITKSFDTRERYASVSRGVALPYYRAGTLPGGDEEKTIINSMVAIYALIVMKTIYAISPDLYEDLVREGELFKDYSYNFKMNSPLSFGTLYYDLDPEISIFNIYTHPEDDSLGVNYPAHAKKLYDGLNLIKNSTINIVKKYGDINAYIISQINNKFNFNIGDEKFIFGGIMNMNNLINLVNRLQASQAAQIKALTFAIDGEDFTFNFGTSDMEDAIARTIQEVHAGLTAARNTAPEVHPIAENNDDEHAPVRTQMRTHQEETYTAHGMTVKRVDINGTEGFQRLSQSGVFIPCTRTLFEEIKAEAQEAIGQANEDSSTDELPRDRNNLGVHNVTEHHSFLEHLFGNMLRRENVEEERVTEQELNSAEEYENAEADEYSEPTADELNTLDPENEPTTATSGRFVRDENGGLHFTR